MELGGYVTVIYGSPLDSAKPWLQIGEVDLGANVNISEEVVASVVLKTWSRLDSIWIDQALVSYKPGGVPVELLFGQQTFDHGLLTTRLITNPLILDSLRAELKMPGAIVNGTWGICSGGLGLAVLAGNPTAPAGLQNVYSSVVNLDIALPNESTARLSSFINKNDIDLDLATNFNFWKLVFDLEGIMSAKSTSEQVGVTPAKPSGFYAGALLNVTNRLGLALRADGISWDNFKEMELRYAGGVVVGIKDGIFCAVELAHMAPQVGAGSNEIQVELGLERKIQLPGFQRKTLTQE